MNILFITSGPIEWATSRMRAFWVAEALRERGHDVVVETYQHVSEKGLPFDYNAYIWQKTASASNIGIHKRHDRGAHHYWDICDPLWWWQPNECREIAKHMTAVVCSSQALADDFNQWYGQDTAVCIPDRLKLSHFHTQRQHRTTSPVRLIWFGISANRIALWAAKANLERLVANGYKIELTILDERPDIPFRFSEAFPIYQTQWLLDKEVEILASHDIALLPPYPGPWGEVKSDNKSLTAAACSIPVWDGIDYQYGEMVMHHDYRVQNFQYMLDRRGDVKQSAAEWEELLS